MRLDPKFALAWALLSYVDSRRLPHSRVFNQRSPSVKRHGRQPKPRSLFSPISARPYWPRDITTTACLKDYDTAVRYFEQARQLLPE